VAPHATDLQRISAPELDARRIFDIVNQNPGGGTRSTVRRGKNPGAALYSPPRRLLARILIRLRPVHAVLQQIRRLLPKFHRQRRQVVTVEGQFW